jgi:ubiquinone/menaquinone biosynthesis C-methylase UbiE
MLRSRLVGIVAVGLIFAACALAHDIGEEVDRIAELMELRPGMQVADVGAGEGGFSRELARRMGNSGHVFATEVDDGELKKLREMVEENELTNISVVVGETDDTGLPDACCDAVLLRYVYHHMSHPADMRASLRRSLRPGGRLLVIEKKERGDGIEAEELVGVMTADGFEVESRHPEWGGHDDHYAVVFLRPDRPTPPRGN